MQRMPSVQCIESAENGSDLASHEALGLRPHLAQPRAEVAVLGVFHREAIAHVVAVRLDEAIEDAKGSVFARQQFGEVRFAEPSRDAVADLHADVRGNAGAWRWCREIDLAETTLSNQSVEAIGAAGF